MPRMKRVQKSVSILMAVLMVMISTPVSSVFAAMIGTEALLVNQDSGNARDRLRSFLDRKDVQSRLTALGINPTEARARSDSLSDVEVRQIAGKIDQLPAAGDFGGTALYLAIIAFVVLVVLELLGYTDFI